MDELEQIKDFLVWARANDIRFRKCRFGQVELELEEPLVPVATAKVDAKDFVPPEVPKPGTLYEHLANRFGMSDGDDETGGLDA